MKRLLALILAVSMCFVLASCGDEKSHRDDKGKDNGIANDIPAEAAGDMIASYGVAVMAVEGGICDVTSFVDEDEITAKATPKSNILAPGTSGSLAPLVFVGTNEKDLRLDIDEEFEISNFEVDGQYYCPLMITVGEKNLFGEDYDSAREFENAVEREIENFYEKKVYKTGTDFSALNDGVKWEWAFGGYGTDEAKDTALGDAAAAGKGCAVSLELSVEIDD